MLQRQDFYVAMRAVALAQSGDSTITRERVRETATDSIAMATFKGMPAAPVKYSKGKKQNPNKEKLAKQEPATPATKNSTGPKKNAASPHASAKTTAGKKTALKEGNPGNNVKTKGAKSDKRDTKSAQASEKKHNNKPAVNVGKGKRTTNPEGGNGGGSRGDSSSFSSEAASDSDNDGDDSSRSGGEEKEDDDDGDASRASSKSSGDPHNSKRGERSESSDSGSDSDRSVNRLKEGRHQRNQDDDENHENSRGHGSSVSGSSSDSDAGSSTGPESDENGDDESGSVGGPDSTAGTSRGSKRIGSARSQSSYASLSASSSSGEEEEGGGPDAFSMSEKAQARYQVGGTWPVNARFRCSVRELGGVADIKRVDEFHVVAMPSDCTTTIVILVSKTPVFAHTHRSERHQTKDDRLIRAFYVRRRKLKSSIR